MKSKSKVKCGICKEIMFKDKAELFVKINGRIQYCCGNCSKVYDEYFVRCFRRHIFTNELYRQLLRKKRELNAIKKFDKSHRGFGFRIIKKNILDEDFVFHHINDIDVIAFPKDIHILYGNKSRSEHRFFCNQVAIQIYGNLFGLRKC